MINRFKKQSGDTLVEVMISIAIVALAIAISYAISGKNLNVGITARERTSAVGLASGQIERMNQALKVNPSVLANLNNQNKHFCFDVKNVTNNTPVPNGAIDPVNNTLTVDATNYTNGANSCVSGNYYLDINFVPLKPNPNPNLASGNSYAFTARWLRIGGGTDQIVNLYYRPQ